MQMEGAAQPDGTWHGSLRTQIDAAGSAMPATVVLGYA